MKGSRFIGYRPCWLKIYFPLSRFIGLNFNFLSLFFKKSFRPPFFEGCGHSEHRKKTWGCFFFLTFYLFFEIFVWTTVANIHNCPPRTYQIYQ